MKFQKNWQEFGGRLIPRQVLESLLKPDAQHIPSRLKVGDKVRVGMSAPHTDESYFAPAIVTDVMYSEQSGWSWDLAFPIGNGDFYAVVKNFGEEGLMGTAPDTLGPYSSGIFTEAEYEIYLDSLRETTEAKDIRPSFKIVK